jgi:ssDNA-binding replication factor A large subunit
MEKVDLEVVLMNFETPREVTTYSGLKHTLVEGTIKDSSGTMNLTIWNDKIELLNEINPGDQVELTNCFITSFKGVLSVNVGRDSEINKK